MKDLFLIRDTKESNINVETWTCYSITCFKESVNWNKKPAKDKTYHRWRGAPFLTKHGNPSMRDVCQCDQYHASLQHTSLILDIHVLIN